MSHLTNSGFSYSSSCTKCGKAACICVKQWNENSSDSCSICHETPCSCLSKCNTGANSCTDCFSFFKYCGGGSN